MPISFIVANPILESSASYVCAYDLIMAAGSFTARFLPEYRPVVCEAVIGLNQYQNGGLRSVAGIPLGCLTFPYF